MNRIIAITGANSGLGKALAIQHAKQGDQVILLGKNIESLSETLPLVAEFSPLSRVVLIDIRNFSQVELAINNIYSHEKKIDIFYNNASISSVGDFEHVTEECIDDLIQTNVLGTFYTTQLVYQKMIEQGFGQIVNISSIAGIAGYPACSVYAGTKSAAYNFSKSLRDEAEIYNVKVSVVCSGYIDTPIFSKCYLHGYTANQVIQSIKFKILGADYSARKIIKAVEKGKFLIIFPLFAKFLYYLNKFSPCLMPMVHSLVLKDLKKAQASHV